ncbi:MAG: hypothetical protein KatS3mg081_0906 [Gemmatimonadales bacterium]|nr:MAG: hypothetical protein KatS3mg081_0906 [Gemmatimonadales bacterium]
MPRFCFLDVEHRQAGQGTDADDRRQARNVMPGTRPVYNRTGRQVFLLYGGSCGETLKYSVAYRLCSRRGKLG